MTIPTLVMTKENSVGIIIVYFFKDIDPLEAITTKITLDINNQSINPSVEGC